MLCKSDLDQIERIVRINTDHLLTKDEFFKAMEEMMREIKIIREEIAGMCTSCENHKERITALEEVVFPAKAS